MSFSKAWHSVTKAWASSSTLTTEQAVVMKATAAQTNFRSIEPPPLVHCQHAQGSLATPVVGVPVGTRCRAPLVSVERFAAGAPLLLGRERIDAAAECQGERERDHAEGQRDV